MGKNRSKEKNQKTPLQNICFSFAHILNKCVAINHKNYFSFTNKVPAKEIKKYRSIIENALYNWSKKTVQQLEQEQVCYPVKSEIINKTRDNIAQIFQKTGYNLDWIKQNIRDRIFINSKSLSKSECLE